MTNPRGARWERRLADWLTVHGHQHADRRVKTGAKDKGDIGGIAFWCIEAKNCKTVDLAGWLDEAEKEAANAGVTRFCVMFPRRSRQVGDGYCVMPIWLAAELMMDLS